jgi:predicted enzyme related to lactoylglutathione lyase
MADDANHPVVHFEIIGAQPERLRGYYAELFGWRFDTGNPVSEAVSDPDDYGFVDAPGGVGIPGGVGGGPRHASRAIFYVAVDDVERALRDAERLGGTRVLDPARAPSGLVVGHFTDPAGNLVGLAALPDEDS